MDEINVGIDDDKFKMCTAEAEVLKQMKHKNIVEYHSDYFIGFNHFIQMNLCEYSLDDWIEQRGQQPLSQSIFFHFLNQILDGIEYLHSHNYVLRDLSIKNILITQDGTIKLCDFGLIKKTDTQTMLSQVQSKNVSGVFAYYPPELIQDINNGSKVFVQSKRGDIWALGICLSLLGGLKFLQVANFNQLDSQIEQSPLLDYFCNSIILLILKKDPKERPSIQQIRQYMYNIMIQSSEVIQINQSKKQNQQIQENLDDYYNKRELDIEITKYKETETECYQNLNKIESLIKLGYINLYCHNNIVNALQYFIDAMLLNKDDPDIYLGLAQVQIEKWQIEQKNGEKIEFYIEKANEIQPNYWRVYYLKYQSYLYKDDYQQATKCLLKSIEIKNHPMLKSRYYSLSSLLTYQTKRKYILEEFEKEKFPVKYRLYYYDLAQTAKYSNEFKKSINYYKKEFEYFPNNPKLLFQIGKVYEKQNNYNDAIEYYKKSIELNPLFQKAQNSLNFLIQNFQKQQS